MQEVELAQGSAVTNGADRIVFDNYKYGPVVAAVAVAPLLEQKQTTSKVCTLLDKYKQIYALFLQL